MIGVVQRVHRACVQANAATAGRIGAGLLIFLGVYDDDTGADAQLLARKVANLRVFCDAEDKMNRSVLDTGGDVLVVSNFTLCADTKKGNRPSFSRAMAPAAAEQLYLQFAAALRENGVGRVETGVFGAEMQVDASCNGPVTILLDTTIWRGK